MKKIIYISDSYEIGGTELYVFRLFEVAKCNNCELYTVLLNDTRVTDYCQRRLNELDVKVLHIKECYKGYKLFWNCDEIDEHVFEGNNVYFFSTSLRCFIAAHFLQKMYNRTSNVRLYVLHPEAVMPFSYISFRKKSSLLKKIIIEIMKLIMFYPIRGAIQKMIEDKQIVFMDTITYETTRNVFRLKKQDFLLLRIGMFIPEWNDNINRKSTHSRMILSIARFDFPFKGYIIGLIKDFCVLKNKYKDVELVLIGNGQSSLEVEELLKTIPHNVIDSIKWIKYVPFDNLNIYFEKAYVYVGMGTTVLNAAQYGLPSIVASVYQRDDFSSGFFFDFPLNVGCEIWCEDAKKYRIIDLLEKILKMSSDDYKNKSKLTYDVYKNNYNIQDVFPILFNFDLCNNNYYKKLGFIKIIKLLHKKITQK